jgi:2-polyprenyl-6-methoxyphenol hydroxylase-like FAD-dependent oxidoreductase
VELKGDNLVTAHFEDGTEATANLLIGAEGAHSRVRDFLLGPETAALNPSPVVASLVLTTLNTEAAQSFLKLHHRSSICFHPDGYFMWWGRTCYPIYTSCFFVFYRRSKTNRISVVHDIHDKADPAEWVFMGGLTYMQEEPVYLKGREIVRDIKSRTQHFAEPFRTFTAAIPDDAPAWHNRLSYWVPQPWENHNGRVTIIGDAAHPMTFRKYNLGTKAPARLLLLRRLVGLSSLYGKLMYC